MISRTELPGFNKKIDVAGVFIDHKGEILLLHRQDHKPHGGTWAVPAGKADPEEDFIDTIIRETLEETELVIPRNDLRYFDSYFVRHDGFDFKYHVFHLPVDEKPILKLNREEHKDFQWLKPVDALRLNLIPDEDACIKWFYNL
jgi:8-oxo-dGTP pyrophosphatase MutT (NUDIX family)